MPDAYLELALEMLQVHGRPMSAREIVDLAVKYRMMPGHLHGKTIHKTLQARLSEDLVKNRFQSKFYRVSPGRFFVRAPENFNDGRIDEYIAVRRRRSVRRNRLLCVPKVMLPDVSPMKLQNFDLYQVLSSESARYVLKSEADKDKCLLKVMTFTVIIDGDCMLIHQAGKYSNHQQYFAGNSFGIRGYVTEFDIDLLNEDVVGIKRNSCNEVFRFFTYRKEEVSDIDIIGNMKITGWFHDDDSSIVFVVCLDLSKFRQVMSLKSRALGAPMRRWLITSQIGSIDLEEWSKSVAVIFKDMGN